MHNKKPIFLMQFQEVNDQVIFQEQVFDQK